MQKKLALLISYFFQPITWLLLFALAVAASAEMSGKHMVVWSVTLGLILILLPALVIFFRFKQGRLSDWDISKRTERPAVIMIILFFWTGGLALVRIANGPHLILALLSTALLTAVLFLCVTFITKISNHSLAATAGPLLLAEIISVHSLWLLFTLPAMFWSRHYLGRHTWFQLCLGSILGVIAWLIFKIIH